MRFVTVLSLYLFLALTSFASFAEVCTVCHRTIPAGSNFFQSTDGSIFCSGKCARAYIKAKAPKCYVCGRAVEDGYQNDGRFFCSKKCLDSWSEQFAKVCCICGKKTQKYVTSNGKIYCSNECFEKTLPVCGICRKRIIGEYFKSEDKVFCSDCYKQPKCAVCNMPAKRLRKQRDGRKLCSSCVTHGIFSLDEGYKEFTVVRLALGKMFNLKIDGNVNFHLVGVDEMGRISGHVDTPELGLCVYNENTLETEDGIVVERKMIRDIYILYGLPREQFRSVAAHELAHDWFDRNVSPTPPLDVGEGWAQYVAWCYCKAMGYKEQMEVIEKNNLPGYSDGFRMISKKLNIADGPARLSRQLKILCK